MSKKIMMCPPTYYGVEYVINPHMEGNIHHVNRDRAQSQWDALIDVISIYAWPVCCEPVEGLPDMVFTANAGLYLRDSELFIASNFATKERAPETKHFIDAAQEILPNAHVLVLDTPSFEGAGDCLEDEHGTLFLGNGSRTAPETKQYLEAFREVVSINLVDPYFYHLDTCFAPLLNGKYMMHMPAFDIETQVNLIHRLGASNIISVCKEDAMRFACNAVVIDDMVITNAGVSPAFIEKLREAGLTAISVDLSEFVKAGGAAKCLTLNI